MTYTVGLENKTLLTEIFSVVDIKTDKVELQTLT